MSNIEENQQLENERKIVHLLLKDIDVIHELYNAGVNHEVFNNVHQTLIESIFNEYTQSGRRRLLSRENFRTRIIASPQSNEVMGLLTIYDKCFVGTFAKSDDISVFRKQLVDDYACRSVQTNLKQFRELSNRVGYFEAAHKLIDNLKKCVSFGKSGSTLFSSLFGLKDEYINKIEFEKAHPEAIIRCNIPEIDESMQLGLKKGHLTLFVGPPGGHKTNILLNIGINVAQQKYPVLFIPLEMNWDELYSRILCNRTSIPSVKLANPSLLTEQEIKQLREAEFWAEDLYRHFYLLESSMRFSVSVLSHEIEKRIIYFKPKLVVVDYADILDKDQGSSYESRTLEIDEMVKRLIAMGKQYEFHIMTAAQMNRATIRALRDGKEEAADTTSVHGSQMYGAHATAVFGLMPIPGEENRIKLYRIKARHGPCGDTKELRIDKARYQVSSTSKIKDIENQLAKNAGLGTSEKDLSVSQEDIRQFTQSQQQVEFAVPSEFDF